MKHFHIDRTPYELPSEWTEVPTDCVLPILLLIYSKGRTAQGRLQILSLLNPVPAKTYKKLVAWQINELCRLLDWVYETPLESKPFDSFIHEGVVYYLPADGLSSVSFLEFQTAVAYLYRFYYDTEEKATYLTRLVATLCRPGVPGQSPLSLDFTGDLREPFNENVVEHRAKLFLNLEAGIAAGVLQYFVSQFRGLYETYQVFEKDETSDTEDPEETQFEWVEQLLSLRKLSFEVAEVKLIGNVREVEKAPVNLVFETLEHMTEKENKKPAAAPSKADDDEEEN
ncbi:hypothetical protein [Siphonobacter sp. SORGH_AS_0500]|uniref:hypothetical protein n=1 Tax=Siphonobacter sp. SORGH_AS_0500 TaxID=1864824 RepID=UPI0028552B96|nr:hypothetical protein [Siphonobacter sp. SORGH_AS_0500]MDR6195637.1 hypothetical protein [Siphonobacter sp. SORGH_AS_0500]